MYVNDSVNQRVCQAAGQYDKTNLTIVVYWVQTFTKPVPKTL